MESKLKKIISETEPYFSHEYLNKLVVSISSAIDMEYFFIARTDLEKDMSTTMAVARHGELAKNFEYHLKDTPCEDVAKNSLCSYVDNVSKTFSKDKLLIDMHIKGYVGSPLHDLNNNVIGIVVALSEKPIKDVDSILTIMEFFSGRIAAELDRMLKEDELKKINHELKALNDTLEEKVKFATIDLKEAQSLAKVGSWRYDIDKDTLIWSDETYDIYQIDKIKHPINTQDDFFSSVDPNYVDIVKQTYQKHLDEGTLYNITHELELNDGTSKWIHEKCETSYDENGKPVLSHGVLQDVTEVIRRNELLIQQSRMVQMGEMLAMIAHQWRQPLAAISATTANINIMMSLEKFDLKEEKGREECLAFLSEKLDNIDTYVESLTTTVNDFRTFYKPGKEASSINFIEPLDKAINIMRPSLESEKIEIIQTCTVCNHKIKIHSNELMQVILSILQNSLDNFIEKKTEGPQITITCKCDNDKVILVIGDNGGGIPEDILTKIFDPYFSTKSEKNGTGLGLYMSKLIIEEHHRGRVYAKNREGGVSFTIELNKNGQTVE
jgi:signal transduction histidine kinase